MIDRSEACRALTRYIACEQRGDKDGAREQLVALLSALDAGEHVGSIVRSDLV